MDHNALEPITDEPGESSGRFWWHIDTIRHQAAERCITGLEQVPRSRADSFHALGKLFQCRQTASATVQGRTGFFELSAALLAFLLQARQLGLQGVACVAHRVLSECQLTSLLRQCRAAVFEPCLLVGKSRALVGQPMLPRPHVGCALLEATHSSLAAGNGCVGQGVSLPQGGELLRALVGRLSQLLESLTLCQ